MKYTLLSCAALALMLPASAHACSPGGPNGSGQHMMMEKLDTDKNGTLSTAEADAGALTHFKAMDANADGVLSAAEFEKAPRPYNKDGRDDGATRKDGKDLSERLGFRRDKRFAIMDTDANGSVSQAEFMAGAQKRHEMMDADKDGTITHEEMAAKREKMKEKWQDRRGDRGWGGRTPPARPDEAPGDLNERSLNQ
jgi:hypothetical protein